MGLQQQVSLHVGVIELRVVQLVGHFLCKLKCKEHIKVCYFIMVCFCRCVNASLFESRHFLYLSEKCILVVSDGNVLILGSIGDDLN